MGRRAILLTGLVVACVLGAVAYVVVSVTSATDTTASGPARAVGLPDAPYLVFRTLDRDDPGNYGHLAVAPLGNLEDRTVSTASCERLHVAGGRGICVQLAGRVPLRYRARILDGDLVPRDSVPLQGFPSRARVSPDGRLGSVTSFVSGHSYAELGVFSTETTIIDLTSGTVVIDNLEDVPIDRDGERVDSIDANLWGVTFAPDSDAFYATLSTGGRTYLVKGSVRGGRMNVVRENAECPSLSPDGDRVVYKKRGGGDGLWRFTMLDLATMRETPLAETASIDDQVEWIDGGTVAYRNGEALWSVPADGSGRPTRLTSGADSPAAVQVPET